jgi:hypothetical protein
MMSDGFIAKAGEEIREIDGTLVATVKRDIPYGSNPLEAANFTMADGSSPVPGAVAARAILYWLEDKRK